MLKNVYIKVSLNFIRKHILIYLLVLIAILVSVYAVFVPFVTAKSQSINYKKVVEKVYPDYPATSYYTSDREAKLIEENKAVSKSIKYENYGLFTSQKSRLEYELKGYTREALEANQYVLASGRLPRDNGEMLLDRSYLSQEGSPSLGDFILGINNLEYELGNKHEIYSATKKYKIVGLIEKNKDYTRAISKIKTKNRVRVNPILWIYNTDKYPDQSLSYTVLIKFKDGMNNLYGNCVKLGIDVADDPQKVIQNFELSRLNESISYVTRSNDDKILIFVAVLFIASLFKLLNDIRLRNMGLLKILGAKSKDVFKMLIGENLLLGLLGLVLGLCISYVLTYRYIGGSNVTDSAIDVMLDNYRVYFNAGDILLVITVIFAPILVNIIYLIIKYNKTEGLDLLNEDRKTRAKNINLEKIRIRNIVSKIAIIGFLNNLYNYLLPILIIVIMVSSIINVLGVEKTMAENDSAYDVSEASYLGRNFLVKKNSSFSIDNGIDSKDLVDINKYKNFTQNMELYGYLFVDSSQVNNSVLESKGISSSRGKYEFDCNITGIDSLRQGELKDKGILSSEDIKSMGQENQAYAVINNFYYDGQTDKYQKFLKNLKDGQLVYIKLPCIKNGLQTYRILPVKLIQNKKPKATIEERTASNSSTVEIMFDLNRLKSLANTSTVSAIRFYVTSSEEANLVKTRLSSRFEVKDRDRERLNKKELRDKIYFDKIKFRLSFYSILLLFSLVFTIRIITDKKTRDVGVLRMLGADKRLINKTLFVENMIFVVTSLVIGVSIGLYRVYKYYKITRDLDLYYKGIAHVEFHPPYATIIVLIVLVFIISMLMQMYSNKRLVSKNIMLDTRSE